MDVLSGVPADIIIRSEEDRPADTARSGRTGERDLCAMRRDIRDDQVADGASRVSLQQQVPQPRMLEGMAHGKQADAFSETPEGAVPDDRGALRDIASAAGRRVCDLWKSPNTEWQTTCGGPRSCDGSCARFAVFNVQSGARAVQGQPVLTGFGTQVSGPPVGFLKPGPVWHASAAAAPGIPLRPEVLRAAALLAIKGVGDARVGEWEEYTGYAFHIRRRLNAVEQRAVGEVIDIRGTPEADRRLAVVKRWLPEGHAE